MKRVFTLLLSLCILWAWMPLSARAAEKFDRLSGENRIETCYAVADAFAAAMGGEKLEAVIIADSRNFADALSGSYLACVKNAPILLTYDQSYSGYAAEYIQKNLAEDGTVYILGGGNAVPSDIEDSLSGLGRNVVRLAGSNRFETNLLILREAGVTEGQEILVCTGTNFADSLSASAAGLPILLVWNESGALTASQAEYLAALNNEYCIIGGESAVGAALAAELANYGSVDRLAGSNRFETSVLVAERYFESPETAVLAYAWNFPDGLCGGPLAYAMGCPLLLTMTDHESLADDYTDKFGIGCGTVLGGEGLISDAATAEIFSTEPAELTMNVTEKTITAGDTYQVDYTYTGDKSNLTWTSSNTSVATVNQSGVVTALAEGNTTIKVTDGTNTKRCKIYVEAGSSVKATDIVISYADSPFYDGVTRYAGDYVYIKVSNRPYDAERDVTVTSSNSSVVSVSKGSISGGDVGVTLNFKSAGSATIKITSADGAVSKSYTINVYAGYSFHPGGGQLTPEQFASYTTRVMCANGFTETACGSWREFTLTADQLTFSKAVSVGQSYVHSWWPNGCRYCQIVYVGQDDSGNYVFHACWG